MFLCLNLICILLFHWSVDVSEPENVPVCPKNIPQFWRCLYSQFFIICERSNCWICALSFLKNLNRTLDIVGLSEFDSCVFNLYLEGLREENLETTTKFLIFTVEKT